MLTFLSKRLGRAVVVVLLIAVANFLIVHAAPGDAADVLAGEAGASDAGYIEALRSKLGLDRPLGVQIALYPKALLSGDLGFSVRNNMPVLDLILGRLPATLLLIVGAITLAVVGGSILGLLAAFRRGTATDWVVSVLALVGYATPLFWLGLMLVIAFSVQLRWLPSSGMTTAGSRLGGAAAAWDLARHLILPTLTLSLFYLATYTRIVRASALDILNMDFIRTAHAKGVSLRRIAFRHVLRNALLPVLTVFGLQFGSALGGAVVVEVVFGWPGMGRLAYEAISQRDVSVLLGILLMSSILVVVVNVLVDLTYTVVDPRIELR